MHTIYCPRCDLYRHGVPFTSCPNCGFGAKIVNSTVFTTQLSFKGQQHEPWYGPKAPPRRCSRLSAASRR